MSWGEVFLGIIAVATLATSAVQIGVLIAAGRLAKRVEHLADRVEGELKPLFGHLDAIGRDASRAASLAADQVERVDGLFADLVSRIEEMMRSVQTAAEAPAREAAAVIAGLRAAANSVRQKMGRRPRGRGEDEDALFI